MRLSRARMMVMIISVLAAIPLLAILPDQSTAVTEEQRFVTHSGAVIRTTGEVLDPLYTVLDGRV